MWASKQINWMHRVQQAIVVRRFSQQHDMMRWCFLIMVVGAVGADHIEMIKRLQDHCEVRADPLRCYKIKAVRFVERVARAPRVELFEGLDIVQETNRTARAKKTNYKDKELEEMEADKFDDFMYQIAYDFLESHSFTMNIPKMVEEARRRRKKNRFTGPFLAALAIKGVIMSMAYKSIAVMSGTALIIGKMALILAAILGLKKLVSNEKEKTTVEIVKHPTHSTSHTYSSSIEEGDGHYHRSMGDYADEMAFLEKLLAHTY